MGGCEASVGWVLANVSPLCEASVGWVDVRLSHQTFVLPSHFRPRPEIRTFSSRFWSKLEQTLDALLAKQ